MTLDAADGELEDEYEDGPKTNECKPDKRYNEQQIKPKTAMLIFMFIVPAD